MTWGKLFFFNQTMVLIVAVTARFKWTIWFYGYQATIRRRFNDQQYIVDAVYFTLEDSICSAIWFTPWIVIFVTIFTAHTQKSNITTRMLSAKQKHHKTCTSFHLLFLYWLYYRSDWYDIFSWLPHHWQHNNTVAYDKPSPINKPQQHTIKLKPREYDSSKLLNHSLTRLHVKYSLVFKKSDCTTFTGKTHNISCFVRPWGDVDQSPGTFQGPLSLTWIIFNPKMGHYTIIKCSMKSLINTQTWIARGMEKQFHPTLYWACDYLFRMGIMSIHVIESAPGMNQSPRLRLMFKESCHFTTWFTRQPGNYSIQLMFSGTLGAHYSDKVVENSIKIPLNLVPMVQLKHKLVLLRVMAR